MSAEGLAPVGEKTPLYGIMGRFASPAALLAAVEQLRGRGYTVIEAYSPFPVEGLGQALGFKSRGVQVFTLLGGLLGGVSGYALQYWVNLYAYPLNVGGRPLHSAPSFIPITFELAVLFAAFTAVFSMLILNRLPRLHHPIFNAEGFERAAQDGFFLCVQEVDPLFESQAVPKVLQEIGAIEVRDVSL